MLKTIKEHIKYNQHYPLMIFKNLQYFQDWYETRTSQGWSFMRKKFNQATTHINLSE